MTVCHDYDYHAAPNYSLPYAPSRDRRNRKSNMFQADLRLKHKYTYTHQHDLGIIQLNLNN